MAMEAIGLGLFMVAAGLLGTLLEAPGSPVHGAVRSDFARRAMMGLLMGATAIALVSSPWGRRSGAHLNPAVTWTFFRLGRVKHRVAIGYTAAQAVGGILGVALVVALAGAAFVEPPVDAVATLPGEAGVAVAFSAELVISAVLMAVVLALGAAPRVQPFTPLVVGVLVCLYITFEAPLSGMSMNPARSLASAWPRGHWRELPIYFLAPPLGMLLAAEVHLGWARRRQARLRREATAEMTSSRALVPGCAKLLHALPCIFCGGQPPTG
jgi:aquaporin Z